jgi:hypothetical protein
MVSLRLTVYPSIFVFFVWGGRGRGRGMTHSVVRSISPPPLHYESDFG